MSRLFVILSLAIANLLLGQEAQAQALEDYALVLPELQVLLDTAKANSPYLLEQEAAINREEARLASQRGNLLQYVNFIANANYTNSNAVQLNDFSDGSFADVVSDQYNTRVFTGVVLRFSPYDLISRKKERAIQQYEVSAQHALYDRRTQEIESMLIAKYWEVKSLINILELRTEAQEQNILKEEYGRRAFLAGELSALDYTKLMDIVTKANYEAEIARRDVFVAYNELEVMVGVPLHSLRKP